MADAPAAALRRKPGARSPSRPIWSPRGEAAALFSAGHTGATVVAAHSAFGMLPGVDRPALAVTIPTRRHPAILLDVGASVECRPQHLLQFAVMGSVYARVSLGLASPRVGLLSIGEEETKGNELTREAHRLLKASSLGFIGNVEARDVYSGEADVIVCDGFTGNVALKISEGLVDTVEALLSEELSSTFTLRVGSLLTRRALRHFRRRVDYSEYGGAPLLGVAGVAIVGHGRSSALAVRNAVAMAHRFAADRFIEARRARYRHGDGLAPVIAFIFPGQGSQKVGMGKALAEAFPICRDTFAEADEALGEPLSRLIFEGPEDQLTLTENTQPAILAVSTAACRLLESRGITPAFVAGHSLGEYSANVAAGTFEFRRRAADGSAPRPLHAGSRAGRRRRDGGHPRARCRDGRAGVRRGRPTARSSVRRT